jgi:hypothetical protein
MNALKSSGMDMTRRGSEELKEKSWTESRTSESDAPLLPDLLVLPQ